MKRTTRHLQNVLLLISFVAVFACSNDESGKTRFEVRLTDGPGDFEEVNIEIKAIEINSSENDGGWTTLSNTKQGIYNLLDFTNGADTLLASMDVPSGRVSQIRLVLGENNSVKIDGVTYPLKTPSAQQSGLKLKINADLVEGITYRLLLDFDAARSVVPTANGYNLKPVIRAVAEAQTGILHGFVSPAESHPSILAINGTDSIGTYTSDSGEFMIKGLTGGTYKVVFSPKEGYSPIILENVTIKAGEVTELDTVFIQ